MPTVEIDELELQNMRRLTQTVDTILKHPKAGLLVEQAYKMVDANAKTPRLDAAATSQEPIEALQKKFDDFVDETKKEKAEREKNDKLSSINTRILEGKATLRRAGWTDEGMKALDTLMEQKGILDPLDAAAIYERDHPPQSPATPSGSGNWGFLEGVQEGEADLKRLIETKGDSATLIDKMARDALNEIRGASRR